MIFVAFELQHQPGPALIQVVLQPYLAMVLKSLSAGTSRYVKSAAPLPVMWRYMLELSVHSSAAVDIQVSTVGRAIIAKYSHAGCGSQWWRCCCSACDWRASGIC